MQTFVSFGAFLCGRDLGLFGDVGVQKKTKGGLSSRRYRSPAHPHPVRILRFGKLGQLAQHHSANSNGFQLSIDNFGHLEDDV